MIFLYTIFMKVIRLLLPLLRKIPHEKIAYYFQNQGQIESNQNILKPIWIHASSGEIEYARSVIREFKTRYPNIPLLVTHTSLSSKTALSKLGVEAIGVSPLDEASEIQKFLKRFSPRACLIARTDLWPQTLIELHKANIPAYLFSATFSSGTKKTSFWSRQLLKTTLPLLKKIYFVSEADQYFCSEIYQNIKGEILGDTRYDQVTYRLLQPFELSLPHSPKLMIAGSTWPQDEEVLAPAAKRIKAQGWKWIWVPHEVDEAHLTSLEGLLKQNELSFLRLSQLSSEFNWSQFDVVIVDRVGILASLYVWAKIAFIGGSFRRQVHSVMEALAAGLPVLVGPYHHNNREALEFKSQGLVGEVNSADDIYKLVSRWEPQIPEMKSRLLVDIRDKLGSTAKLISSLESEGLFSKN